MTEFTLPYPVSTNRLWRNYHGRMVKSQEAKQYAADAGMLARVAGVDMLDGDVTMELRLFRPAKRMDIDNHLKVILDSMQGILYKNDRQVNELHVYLADDKENPRVEVKAWAN